MPLRIPDKLPAIELLKHENIFVMDESRAHKQEIRPLKICVLNLMPLKITTETDLVRLLSNTPLQLEVYFMKLKSHTPNAASSFFLIENLASAFLGSALATSFFATVVSAATESFSSSPLSPFAIRVSSCWR